jgi:YD repeat-containing protein
MNHLTGVNNTIANPAESITYNYPAPGQNNGQIVSSVDNGTTISYVDDALKRLTSAAGTGASSWNQSYSYDGFGNLTAKNGSGLVFGSAFSVDPTSRLIRQRS